MPGRRSLTAVAVTSGTALALLAAAVTAHGDLPGERAALRTLRAFTGERYDGPLRLLDQVTDSGWLLLAAGVLAAVLLRASRRRAAVLLAVSVAGAVALNPLWKAAVDRPRPDLLPPLADVSALSFPSGHATGTAALALAAVLAMRGHRGVTAAAGALVVVTAAGQLLLAHHHPSDLLGGWLWATAWTAAVWAVGGYGASGSSRSSSSRTGRPA